MATFSRACRKFCCFNIHYYYFLSQAVFSPRGPFASGFLTKVYVVQLGHLIDLDLITLIIFVQEYKL